MKDNVLVIKERFLKRFKATRSFLKKKKNYAFLKRPCD